MKKLLKLIKEFLVTWNEFLTIPLGLLLFWASPAILRFFDSTSAVYDYGIFQIILFTIIQLFIYHGLSWFMMKITWPKLYEFLEHQLEEYLLDKKPLSKGESRKIWIALSIYFSYFVAFILLSRVI